MPTVVRAKGYTKTAVLPTPLPLFSMAVNGETKTAVPNIVGTAVFKLWE
ncbi:MAG: hypothetical protein WAS33_18195 [Candidatus Promineifilaceae bacterium]|nr:hypothetical protein [Anaerolineaceae bacterium]